MEAFLSLKGNGYLKILRRGIPFSLFYYFFLSAFLLGGGGGFQIGFWETMFIQLLSTISFVLGPGLCNILIKCKLKIRKNNSLDSIRLLMCNRKGVI